MIFLLESKSDVETKRDGLMGEDYNCINELVYWIAATGAD